MKRLLATIGLICTALPAVAGIPQPAERTCPIGGEVFEITQTASCSTMGRTMSFRPVTSCDFVTRIPICPSNGLPLYKTFSEQDLSKLKGLIASDSYTEIRALPAHQRAYAIQEFLGATNTPDSFSLMLGAFWYETKSFVQSAKALDNLLFEAERELEQVDVQTRPYIQAILAYALGHSGRIDAAKAKLAQLRQDPATPEALGLYLDAVETCLEDFNQKACHPDAPQPR